MKLRYKFNNFYLKDILTENNGFVVWVVHIFTYGFSGAEKFSRFTRNAPLKRAWIGRMGLRE